MRRRSSRFAPDQIDWVYHLCGRFEVETLFNMTTSAPKYLIALILSALCMYQPAVAEEDAQASEEAIEEIVVRGQKSLVHLRFEAYKAEDNFYSLFNQLNDDDDFDVRCYMEAPTGSRIRKRICRTKFEEDVAAQQGRELLLLGDPVAIEGVIARKKELLLEKMAKMAAENEKLREALVEYYDSKYIFETERDRRCEGDILFCTQ